MFKRSFATSKERPGSRIGKPQRRSFKDGLSKSKLQRHLDSEELWNDPRLGATITLMIGRDQRMFAAHECILSQSPLFVPYLQSQSYDLGARKIELPDEDAEVFSCVLEFLYRGDYYPRLLHDKKRNTWVLEDADADETMSNPQLPTPPPSACMTVYHERAGGIICKDAAVYCAAERFGLEDLKRLAFQKQGIQTGIPVDVILRTARFAYAETSEHDARLRAHFLALIIRSRKVFKRSGTMQMEMEAGGSKLFFDLFVAMCNHVEDLVDMTNSAKSSPRTI